MPQQHSPLWSQSYMLKGCSKGGLHGPFCCCWADYCEYVDRWNCPLIQLAARPYLMQALGCWCVGLYHGALLVGFRGPGAGAQPAGGQGWVLT